MKGQSTAAALATAWPEFLQSIASGVPLEQACLKHLITRADIDAITRSDSIQDQRWRDARLAAERCGWSALDFEEIFNRIGAGTSALEAIEQVRGRDDSAVFFRLVEGSADLTARYYAAQRQWAMREATKLIDIADDDTKDTLPGPKGGEIPNMAAVQRSRLMIETRKELMGDWAPRLFGAQRNQVQVNVQINHAERLEEARARARDRRATPRPKVVDAEFTYVTTTETAKSEPAAPAAAEEKMEGSEPLPRPWFED